LSENVLLLTVPFVMYAIFRYLYLVQVQGMGGAPEEILLKDRLLLLDVVGWIVALLFILYLLPAVPGLGTASGAGGGLVVTPTLLPPR
jgi:hypothetical protein